MPETHPLRGSLSETVLCEVLAILCRNGETGVLRLSGSGGDKAIYVQKGKVVFASSGDPDDRLGELLLTHGVLTRSQLEQASSRIGPGKRLGTILVELGFLPAGDLPRWVVEQVKEILFSLFSWTEGNYRFDIGPLPSREVITLRISTTEIFLAGVRRVRKWSVLRKGTGEIQIPYRLAPNYRDLLEEPILGEEERTLLSLLESGEISMEQAAVRSSLTTLLVYQLFFAFRVLGILVPVEALGDLSPAIPEKGPDEPADPGATLRFTLPQPILPARPAAPPHEPPAPEAILLAPVEEDPRRAAIPARGPERGFETVILRSPAVAKSPQEESERAGLRPEAERPSLPPHATDREEPTPPARRGGDYRVIRVEADKLDGSGVQQIEEILANWSRKGYHLAAVVPGRSSGLFGSAPPTFFIFARE